MALTAAQRMRLSRARQSEGQAAVLVDIDRALTEDALIRGGWLRPQDADDRAKFRQALSAAIPAWSQVEIAEDLVTRNDAPSRSVK